MRVHDTNAWHETDRLQSRNARCPPHRNAFVALRPLPLPSDHTKHPAKVWLLILQWDSCFVNEADARLGLDWCLSPVFFPFLGLTYQAGAAGGQGEIGGGLWKVLLNNVWEKWWQTPLVRDVTPECTCDEGAPACMFACRSLSFPGS